MFDVTWGELGILTGIGLVLIGRKDLPVAANALGKQVGRIVGLLQGARIRADRFATDHQLKQLQNEFKSGLRELDAVKAEMAGAMMSNNRDIGGSNLGATVPGVDKKKEMSTMGGSPAISATHHGNAPLQTPQMSSIGADYLAAAKSAEMSQSSPPISFVDGGSIRELAPRSQSVAAVAEEEWEKQGIGFKSIAERGQLNSMPVEDPTGNLPTLSGGGSSILSNYLRQSLIYDQYERTVREQDDALRSRVEKVQRERATVDEDERKR
mmetsp:Transcript_9524/g.14556  ORF Transcript_9524/g.14556 Transcript_9524/m.14556 type:complete len:267 (+) Transcript_9524:140-940(+)|eukprot:CAMPEP_0201730258 /NCGR_PEP_ID=MMETSP0593-20130828/21578_1 /ASSEMBLY_ACC=CAM_ASM_000672 /TAXON_ID=267983 /ORGANISM="Skeletonema japonicum, Strain CCMP2506" /LENGTH=266 /DNA_ID=CAMNT_0048222759 /DNA_START=62 /DNA_END=862 /DNA_ORIENTATION=+